MNEFWGGKNTIQSVFQVLFPHQISWNTTFISGIKGIVESLFYLVQKLSPGGQLRNLY